MTRNLTLEDALTRADGEAFDQVYRRIYPNLQQNHVRARGLLSESASFGAISVNSFLIDGTLYAMLVPVEAGMVISNVCVSVATGGTGTSTSLVGIYLPSTLGKILGSADQASAWDTAGNYTVSLGGTYTVPDGVTSLYGCVLAKTATTMCKMMGGQASAVGAQVFGTGLRAYATMAAQTTMPATITLAQTAAIALWVGLS